MPDALRAVAVLLVVFVSAAAAEPSAAPSPVGPPANQSAWVGTWELDKKASDPIDHMIELMEVPWYLRALANTFTPTFIIAVDGKGFDWSSKTPLGSKTQHLRADGVAYPGEDQLDRKFTQTSRWTPAGGLVVDRTTEIPSGKKVAVQSNWTVDGNTMTNQMKVTPPDGKAFELKRVFEREAS